MYAGVMSDWNYTKCAKPFESAEAAESYLIKNDFAGYVLSREIGFAAVCPTYPDGYYPDAEKIREVENSKLELQAAKANSATSCC